MPKMDKVLESVCQQVYVCTGLFVLKATDSLFRQGTQIKFYNQVHLTLA